MLMPEDAENAFQRLQLRVGALEALLQNLYAKYFLENSAIPSVAARQSLQKAREADYPIGSLHGEVDAKTQQQLQELIVDFFDNHLSIITTMELVKDKRQALAPVSEAWASFFEAQYPDNDIVEIADVEVPSSDQVQRVWLEDAQERQQSFIVKTLSDNDARNAIVEQYGLFDRELFFYQEIAPKGAIAYPKLLAHSQDPSYLIMEDMGRYVSGDQEFGYTLPEAKSVIDRIAEFHAFWLNHDALERFAIPRVNSPMITDELPKALEKIWAALGETFRAYAGAEADTYVSQLIENIDTIAATLMSDHRCILHGDLRLDNVLFEKYTAKAFIDWQMLAIGSPMMDIAYFISQSGTAACQAEAKDYAFEMYADKIYQNKYEVMNREYNAARLLNLSTPIFAAYGDITANGEMRTIALDAFKRAIDNIGALT